MKSVIKMSDLIGTLSDLFTQFLSDVAAALPAIIAAIIVLIIGYVVGKFLGRAVNKVVEKLGIEKSFDETDTGKSFRRSGMDLSSFIGGVVTAFVIIISVVIAIEILNIGGVAGEFLVDIAAYLPRLLGGVVIIILGTVLVGFLASLVGNTLKPIFPKAKSEIADMLKNLLQIGLIAVILLIALDLMQLSGDLVYPLILGFVIIGAGIALTDGLIKSITDDHKEFIPVAGYAKFVLYSIFLVIGAGAIFATFQGVTDIVANISWAFAIAMGIMLVPVIYNLARKMTKEVE
jgi:putative Mn2+ efflux pump MntP